MCVPLHDAALRVPSQGKLGLLWAHSGVWCPYAHEIFRLKIFCRNLLRHLAIWLATALPVAKMTKDWQRPRQLTFPGEHLLYT